MTTNRNERRVLRDEDSDPLSILKLMVRYLSYINSKGLMLGNWGEFSA